MAGTKEGGLKAAATNRKLHGEDFYKRIGAKGGSKITLKPKGFGANPERAKLAGAKGGFKSRRGPTPKTLDLIDEHEIEILTMKGSGFTCSQIGKTFGIPPKTVERWLEKQIGEQK